MLPEVSYLGDNFHELFRHPTETLKIKSDWSKKRKKKWDSTSKKKGKDSGETVIGPPEVELHGNPSEFAVFAHVRQAVLESWAHKATEMYLNSSSSVPVIESGYEGDSESDVTEIYHPQPSRVPKIVGVGLRCVLELIRDSRATHPALCTKALAALLDVLQGQQPQGLQAEPAEVIDPLFDLLLDLATCYSPETSAPDDGNHLTAIACSCLLSLVIVRGSTGKLLSAAAALLMCPKQLANQNIHLPLVMTALQRSIYAVLLGKITRPDWLTHGVPVQSKIDSFSIKSSGLGTVRSLASDGQYLYLYTSRGLFKIGSGHGGTIKGHIYYCVPDFFNDDKGWLGFANGWLWLKVSGKKGCEILRIDRDPFRVVDTIRLDTKDWTPGVWFSDADQLGVITSVCDDGFVVRTLNPNVKPATIMSELSLKLARKSVDVMGSSSFDEESGNKTLNSDFDEEIVTIVAGKEFGLVKTSNGKVYFSGKASSIGMKSGTSGRWSLLTIPKGIRAHHIAVGHEGLHAVIVAEDGSVFFCGTARRGEDGDLNKARRQPKAVKPKKIAKVEEEFIVHAAANNGTTALVTRNGQLLMFGKDTIHCNSSTGQVIAMENLQVTQVALGKAHAVALTSKGIVYTFGINNKGQCGRDFINQVKEAAVIAMETVAQDDEKEDEFDWEDAQDVMCSPGKHQWRHDLCMVCTICRECTGYSISCLSSVRPHRNPGQECGCGEGDSGCSICGCCRVCAKENFDNSDLALLGPSGAGDSSGMMRLDLIFSGDSQAVKHTSRLQEHLQKRLEERKQRQGRKSSSKHYCGLKIKNSSSRPGSSSGKSASSVPLFKAPAPVKFCNLLNEEQAGGSDVEKDASRVTSLPPAPIALPYTCPVIQIACGLHHTVVLTQGGEVFTFGSNIYGQLGIGDVLLRGGPVNVRLPNLAQSVAAGGNHTVILTVKGEVYTFGSYQKGQLGRKGNYSRHEAPWYAIPGPVPGIGPHSGRRATWIGAAGDQTFIKVDESLINSLSLEQATITGNKTCILLIPRGENKSFEALAINRRDGGCAIFSGADQAHLAGSPICLDPLYNVLWSYQQSTNLISCYNIIASEAKSLKALSHSMFDPDLVLPVTPGCLVKRSQAALHLLGALDTLAQAQFYKLEVGLEVLEKQAEPSKPYTLQDFSVVNRFESHGGGWGYSGHSIEAIRFMVDTDLILGGFGLFGGRGEYTAKIKLLDIGVDGGEQEIDGEVIAETEDIPYECGPRQKYPMLFDEPVLLQANRWYIAWARISGPSSDCGSNGQAMITTEDQISFYFKSSKKSNNGTDVNAGQIPQLLYKIITQETKTSPRQVDPSEPVFVLSKDFSSAVTRECFQSLLALIHWGWNALKSGYLDLNGSVSTASTHAEHERLTKLVYINRASLRLIHLFTNEIYPDQSTNFKLLLFSKKAVSESVRLAENLGDVRALLRQILSDKPITGAHKELTDAVLEECHKTFVLIFHALYPTPFLKWTCLCDLLAKIDKTGLHYTKQDRLLSAVLEALCCPTIRLRAALPVLNDTLDPSMRQLSPSDNSGLTVSGSDHHYPLLVEQMSYRTQLEKNGEPSSNWSWKEVLDKLLDLAVLPEKRALTQRHSKLSKELVKNCCNLLARVIAELASQSSGSDEDIQGSCGRVLHVTPSRFLRTNQTRTWNTGNGSPDAICFSVDKPGVVVAGVCVYGGVGMLEYELELLDDQSNSTAGDPSPAQRWTSLEVVKGSFGPDDCVSDIAELKFARPVAIKENVKYAIRLRNQGGRTSNGDGGLSSVKGPDGITFSFSTCSLSFNGTTQTRGQIPQILYYSNPQDGSFQHTAKAVAEHQARKSTLSVMTAIFNRCSSLLYMAREKAEDLNVNEILGSSCALTTLLPLVLAHVGPLGTSDPKSAVQVINLIQDLLPHVAALNLLDMSNNPEEMPKLTTSSHYAWVESDHPYKPASVSNYRVSFPEAVKWMVIEFSPGCGTAQSEDSLKLYIPSASEEVWDKRCCEEEANASTPVPYWRVLRTLRGGTTWPMNAVVLPGNEVIFSLETASDYVKNEKACTYGFRCLVVGYEWNPSPNYGLKHLESELSFVAGMCAASLIKKDLQLPPITVEEIEEDTELAEEAAMAVANEHSSLLVSGLALSQIPTISQALDGILPFSCHSNERLFLKDFIQCSPSTSGGRLARWLQPDSYVDPTKCEVIYNREEMRCGWPANVTVLTKDQYCEVVHVPNLKIDVKAVPIDRKDGGSSVDRKVKKTVDKLPTSLKPPLDVPYEVTVEDKICYHSITMMKAYENFSFEELRYYSPTVKRTSETMLVRPYNDGTYSATWTPSHIGWYSIIVTIDGFPLEEIYKAEVKEPPQGVAPPSQSVPKKATHQPSRVRKFVCEHSAGLRIRAHPSLQSEQIGIVPVKGTIVFMDEIHNDDGVWLRLNYETVKQYCQGSISKISEAWCLQYNQHLGKTLLLPVEEPKRVVDQVMKESMGKKLPEANQKDKSGKSGIPGIYTVVKCGAACHNVRSRPSLQSAPVGMMVLGNQAEVLDQVVNAEGTWVKISPEVASKFCFNHVTEAWSLARSPNNELYLRQELNPESELKALEGGSAKSSPKKGYDFMANTCGGFGTGESFSFTSPRSTPPHSVNMSADPFVFGFGSHDGKTAQEKKNLLKGLKDDGKSGKEKDALNESMGSSVKEFVKAIGESRANGNGIGFQQGRSNSPKAQVVSSRSSSPNILGTIVGSLGDLEKTSQSSSPVPIPGSQKRSPRISATGQGPSTPTSLGYSPLVSGGALIDSQYSMASQRRGSTQSDTSALVSSLTRDLSQSPLTKDLSPSPSSSSLLIRSEGSPGKRDYYNDDSIGHKDTHLERPKKREKDFCSNDGETTKTVAQAGTQTSPDGPGSVKGHFNIGSSGGKEDKISPKFMRKDRSYGRSCKRSMSPAPQVSSMGDRVLNIKEPVKEAMSPSVAESLRAIFSAFLWQEGIVHDAMACASFLKFHPSLPKQGAVVVTRKMTSPLNPTKQELSKEQKQFQRHSVEVSTSGAYLHIQPATLESLTRSAANANANRTRKKQSPQEASIKEDVPAETITRPREPIHTETVMKEKREDDKNDNAGVTVSVLPPALKGLVMIWEEISSTFLRAFEQQVLLSSPTVSSKLPRNMSFSREKPVPKKNSEMTKNNKPDTKRSARKKKDCKSLGRLNVLGEASELVAPLLAAAKERETVCELCGGVYPHPVTYHMRQAHPGCGGLAGGNGYNSSGNFCVGWAGHCGDGGIRGNSWYLICDNCREKYILLKKDTNEVSKDKKKGSGKKKAAIVAPMVSSAPLPSPVFIQNISLDGHIVMKDNAMFLLDLASPSNSVLSNQQRRTAAGPSVPLVSTSSENQSPPDPPGPFPPVVSFQCLMALGTHVKEQEIQEMLQRQLPHELNASCNGNTEPNSSFEGSDTEDQKGRLFHRSISMGTSGIPWAKRESEGKAILPRKRNNSSSGEVMPEGGSSLLCRPSVTLQKLIPGLDESAIISNEERLTLDLLRRPSISFILRRHPIFSLRFAMKHSIRKATCRLYAFQALNWLLRNVTQPVSLHDLLWWFVASLSQSTTGSEAESVEDQVKKEDGEVFRPYDHPLSDINFAGDAAVPLWKAFHQFLQAVADLMFLLPPSCSLQTMAVRCWGLKFSQVDHGFLHRSQFFSNISKILSRSEEEAADDVSVSLQESASSQCLGAFVEALKDLTNEVEIKVSSRQAMIGSLTDNSTETFWESGDEDRNKTKMITVLCPPNTTPKMIYIHIDNCRDLANKVASVTFLSGPSGEDLNKIRQVEVESRSSGWISSPIPDGRHAVIRLELKGPDNSLRIRQIRILGESGETLIVPQRSAVTVQQRLCETETLKVFRLITSQVFGKLIVGESEEPTEPEADRTEDNNDLKEHMVGILFSRSKLTHLQKQVCMHIVHAIRKETSRVREEWECLLCSPIPSETKPSDTYAFEMLSMVLALSGSSVGRVYLSHQYDLLMDLLSLLHTGSARVQRQVTALLRRVLPEVSPATLANVLGVEKLPPSDFSIFTTGSKQQPFDVYKIGILDVFLAVVAKALTVQVKVKGRDVKGVTTVSLATAIHPRDLMGLRWWLRGCISRKLAEDIIQLLNDMSAGKLSEAWANVTKGAIAENIINLTKLDESQRGPTECLKTPTLWLALASLCVLDNEHVERLSSGQWSRADGQPPPPRPTCTNHDDNVTGAIIQCSVCGNLCADCDRYLHLHRRTRMHQRQVCKEEEEAIKVDLHEGCGRTKLFWILALADSCTLKAMVEFREGSKSKSTGTGVCRFCGTTGNSGLLAIGNVCADQECQEHAKNICNKIHPCGHICGGLAGETVCLPCLQNCKSSPNLKQDADDMCMICFTEALSCAPAIQLQCGHVFHAHCSRNALIQRWAGPRITFSFSQCPICKSPMRHAVLSELLKSIQELYDDVKRKALMRLEYEGLHRAVAITSPGAKFFNDPAAYAMDRYAYYVCYKCNKAYYGGEARCDADMNGDYDPSELVCGGCSDVARAQMCPKHGTDFLEYKCRYCCSVAVFFCFGTTHFCNSCHDDFQRVTNIPKGELPNCPAGPKAKQMEGDECPLHVSHPPTGEEFALGCGVCRNAHTF